MRSNQKDRSEGRTLVGYVGVDTASLLITDPGYVEQFHSEYEDDRPDLNATLVEPPADEYPYSIDGAWLAHSNTQGAGSMGHHGVVVGTGLGDGRYPVYVEYVDLPDWGRRVARVTVEFFPEGDR